MASHIIVGLDIGTSSIKAVLAERQRDGRPLLKMAFQEPIQGIRRGVIIDLAAASQGAANAIAEIKKLSRSAAGNIYVSVGTPQVKTQLSRGISAVSRVDTEIYQDDIERVLRASQAVGLGPNRMTIHNVTREFIVDGVGDIADPLGLSGSRLEVQSLIIDVFAPHVKDIIRVVELCGGGIQGMVLAPLTSSRTVLSRTQKDIGTLLIDIGAGTTGMVVYEENKLLGVAIFPLGAGSITNDIAVGLKIPVDTAEKIKLEHGYAVAKEISAKESIDLSKYLSLEKTSASRRLVSEIIECRLAEIFELVNNELKLLGKAKQLPGGAVLTGGGAKIPGMSELIRQELKLSSQIGTALPTEWSEEKTEYRDIFEDPEYIGALGLILWGADQAKWRPREAPARSKLKNLFRHFLP